MSDAMRPRVFRGIGASPGIAIGNVFLLDRGNVRVPRSHIVPEDAPAEVTRLQQAIDKSVQQLEAIRARFVGGGVDHRAILEAHELMVRDQALVDEAARLITDEQLNAEWAVSRVIGRIRALFDQMSDPYLRERKGDIDFVGERILRNLIGLHADLADLSEVDGSHIVVARDLSPVDTAVFTRQKVAAFVTEVGGKTSHTSIIARSLEVPAVVGAHGIFDAAGNGDVIVVDGLDGAVMLRPSRSQLDRGQKRAAQYQRQSLEVLQAKALPARTLDNQTFTVAGNIELPTEVPVVLGRGGEAIGLYRTEYMYMGRTELPTEDDHFATYHQIMREVGDRQVRVRTLDVGGDKIMGPMTYATEPNPALGLRAIRYCLQNREIFAAQIAGLLRAAAGGGELQIMLPMISGIEEFSAAREVVQEVADRLTREGKEHKRDVPLGIMVEVPSAALCADALAAECAFFSIGTNDLLQYLLAIDRTNERVAYLYQPFHPAVLRILLQVNQAAQTAGIPVSVCGEMAGDADFLPLMLGYQFQQLSMNAGSIPKIKRVIRALCAKDCQQLLQEALSCKTTRDVERLVKMFVASKVQDVAAMA